MSIESYNEYVIKSDAETLRDEAKSILAYDEKQSNTWWFGFDREPDNIIENYIHQSARQHNLFESYIGAEWWIREHETIHSHWSFHTDSDVARWRQTGEYVTAPFSTVLYLCDSGQPTVVLDAMHDWTETSGPHIMGDNRWSFWSAPKLGKQICWSLPYYHGVVQDYGHLRNETRITLMFNLWKTRPFEPSCIEYNLPHQIKKGSVTLLPKKEKDIPWLEPHGVSEVTLKKMKFNLQYHGYCKDKKSWLVTQIQTGED